MDGEKVRDVINALYRGSGINKRYTGEVNDRVAEVVGRMLVEIRSCSANFAWISQPHGVRASISWIARNFSRSIVERLRDSQSLACVRTVIYKWDRVLWAAGIRP